MLLNCLEAVAISVLAFVGQDAVNWRDPSRHQVRFVSVDSSVRLEVLDWGGTGRPVLFVGCYLSAHVYDEIAPKLTEWFRVYAVTRRGIGASDRPTIGYDPPQRTADILAVIGALRLEKPILIGNSCGGDILHALGVQQPERVGGLVYLDAAQDPTLKLSDYVPLSAFRYLSANVARLVKRADQSAPVAFPEAEIRQRPLDPAIRKAIVDDYKVKPDYARISVPVLAIYRTGTLKQALDNSESQNDEQLAALIADYAGHGAMLERWQADLREGVPTARIVELPGANLYMFISNEADVIRELRAFAATLPR